MAKRGRKWRPKVCLGLEPGAPEAAVVLAMLGWLVDRRYEASDPTAVDLDAALAEELERVDAMQCAIWEDFDHFEELEPDEEGDGSLAEELRLLHEHWLAWQAA